MGILGGRPSLGMLSGYYYTPVGGGGGLLGAARDAEKPPYTQGMLGSAIEKMSPYMHGITPNTPVIPGTNIPDLGATESDVLGTPTSRLQANDYYKWGNTIDPYTHDKMMSQIGNELMELLQQRGRNRDPSFDPFTYQGY